LSDLDKVVGLVHSSPSLLSTAFLNGGGYSGAETRGRPSEVELGSLTWSDDYRLFVISVGLIIAGLYADMQVQVQQGAVQYEASQRHLSNVTSVLGSTEEDLKQAWASSSEGWAAAGRWQQEYQVAAAELTRQSELLGSYKTQVAGMVSRGYLTKWLHEAAEFTLVHLTGWQISPRTCGIYP
jgi:hypothetical protein